VWGLGSNTRDREGGRQVGVWWLCPHSLLSLQELSKREVVAVGHLEVPAELAGLLQAIAGTSALGSRGGGGQGTRHSHHVPPLSTGLKLTRVPQVAPVRTPRLQAEPRVTLPLDINNYPMAKFIRCHFKVKTGVVRRDPGQSELTNPPPGRLL
jgi:myosin-15